MRRLLIGLINIYRRRISPSLPSTCRFTPTCSQYGVQAIAKHGAFKGGILTFWRILRCNPFSKGGYDPVPENVRGKAKWVL
jgi:putative membrane protein insertion efficiency factor